ncbi:hypothetical protein [Polynucleobacter victoriensis]|uniref:SGNH hydrolase-like domain-containing protein, acetyltransferase AlgX n=1 Tax=Polynucleobacter victoriensis TaxID=2049319 RepID=A0A212T8G4_9BURK|nr:hypothetical protein [Polynucleobacter victoriensis]SNC62084.1 hypothetical protein SAMN06295916_0606 [Polynucleobacter victoriensis]
MNNRNSYIKKSCYLFSILFLISTPIVWLSLTEVNYVGDLTRIGKLSEKDFSSKIMQPTIKKHNFISHPINQADVLVIGDSFSISLEWQSIMLENGLKPATYHWDLTGPVCKNFEEMVALSGFTGKHIIFEVVELGVENKVAESLKCQHTKKTLPQISTHKKAISEPIPVINTSGQFAAGIQTKINSLLLNHHHTSWQLLNKRSKSAYIFPINNGCNLFSHNLCNFGLFYHQDYKKSSVRIETLQEIRKINARFSKYQVSWLVIPNKSSVYQRNIPLDFWEGIEIGMIGPNLLSNFMMTKTTIKDLYLPNDTHLSTSGYLHLGQLMYAFLKMKSAE